jgi:multiple sugar transport system substrate-binding protein
LTDEQIENAVIPGIETGVVRPGHTDSAKVGQTVRAALDSVWEPNADVKASLAGVCDAVAPLLGK